MKIVASAAEILDKSEPCSAILYNIIAGTAVLQDDVVLPEKCKGRIPVSLRFGICAG